MKRDNGRRLWWCFTFFAFAFAVITYRNSKQSAISTSIQDPLISQYYAPQAANVVGKSRLASHAEDTEGSRVISHESSVESLSSNSPVAIVLEEPFVLRDGDVISLKSESGLYIQRFDAFPKNSSYSGIIAYKHEPNPFCYFTIEIVSANRIRLRADNGRYIVRSCCWNGESFIGVQSPDSSDDHDANSVFTALPAGNGFLKLQTDNGAFLQLDHSFAAGIATASALVANEDAPGAQFEVSRIVDADGALVVNSNLLLYSGDVIAIRTNNGAFWRRVHPFVTVDYSGIVAQQPVDGGGDAASHFVVDVVEAEEFHLIADDGGYLMRYCCWNAHFVLAVFRTWAQASARFKLTPVGGRQVQLATDNGMFWRSTNKGVKNEQVDAAIVAIPRRSGDMAHNFFVEVVHLRGILVRHSYLLVSGARVSFINDRRLVLAYHVQSSTDDAFPAFFAHPSQVDAETVFRVDVVSQSQARFLTPDGNACLAPRCCTQDGHPFVAVHSTTDPSRCILFVVPLGKGKLRLRAADGDYFNIAQTSQNHSVLVTSKTPDPSGILYIAVL